MHNETQPPRRPRKTNRCPEWGSRLSVSWTINPKLEKPLAVGDLESCGSAHGGCARIFGRAIARDDRDTRVATQPRGDGRAGSIRQQHDWTSPVEIDDECAVGLPLADGPIVYSDRSQRTDGLQLHAVEETQHRIGARGHRQMAGEASAGFATQCKAYPSLCMGEPTGAACVWWEKPGYRFGEHAPSAGGMVAVEAANLQSQRQGLAKAWKIGGMPDVSAMDGRAGLAADGTASTISANMGNDDEMNGAGDDLVDDAALQR